MLPASACPIIRHNLNSAAKNDCQNHPGLKINGLSFHLYMNLEANVTPLLAPFGVSHCSCFYFCP